MYIATNIQQVHVKQAWKWFPNALYQHACSVFMRLFHQRLHYYFTDSSTKLIPSELERQQRSLISTIGLVETSYTCSEDCLKIDIVIGRSGCITNETSIFLSTLEGTAQGYS